MSFQTFLLIMAVLFVCMAWWANSSKRDKIYCQLTRANKSEIQKFVKMTDRYVIFDNYRFDIIPSCIKWIWWNKGIVGMLFPQFVAKLDFIYNSRFPIDPNTNQPVIISPSVRKVLDKEEWVKSYAKNFTPPSSKKQTMIQAYLPYVSIILVVMVAVYLYTNLQAIGQHIGAIENTLRSIPK